MKVLGRRTAADATRAPRTDETPACRTAWAAALRFGSARFSLTGSRLLRQGHRHHAAVQRRAPASAGTGGSDGADDAPRPRTASSARSPSPRPTARSRSPAATARATSRPADSEAGDCKTENILISGGIYYQATKSLKVVGEANYATKDKDVDRRTRTRPLAPAVRPDAVLLSRSSAQAPRGGLPGRPLVVCAPAGVHFACPIPHTGALDGLSSGSLAGFVALAGCAHGFTSPAHGRDQLPAPESRSTASSSSSERSATSQTSIDTDDLRVNATQDRLTTSAAATPSSAGSWRSWRSRSPRGRRADEHRGGTGHTFAEYTTQRGPDRGGGEAVGGGHERRAEPRWRRADAESARDGTGADAGRPRRGAPPSRQFHSVPGCC